MSPRYDLVFKIRPPPAGLSPLRPGYSPNLQNDHQVFPLMFLYQFVCKNSTFYHSEGWGFKGFAFRLVLLWIFGSIGRGWFLSWMHFGNFGAFACLLDMIYLVFKIRTPPSWVIPSSTWALTKSTKWQPTFPPYVSWLICL